MPNNDAHKAAIELMAETWYERFRDGSRAGLPVGSWPAWIILIPEMKTLFREAASDAHRAYHREYDRMWAE